MKRVSTIAAALLSAAVAVGAAAPPASAAPAQGKRDPHSQSVKRAWAATAKAAAAARQLAQVRRQVLGEITVKDRHLARVLPARQLAAVPVDLGAALVANRDADRAALAGWRTEAQTATLARLGTVRAAVKRIRPEVYPATVGAVVEALTLGQQVDEAAVVLDPVTTPTEVLALVDAATGAVAAVLGAAPAVTARAGHTALKAVHAALAAAEAAVDTLVAAIAALPEPEPEPETPVEEPVTPTA